MFWIGRLCEEFGCLPSAAYREWLACPVGFLEEVIDARAYAKTKAQVDASTKRSEQPHGPLADLVRQIEFGLAQQEIDARTAQD